MLEAVSECDSILIQASRFLARRLSSFGESGSPGASLWIVAVVWPKDRTEQSRFLFGKMVTQLRYCNQGRIIPAANRIGQVSYPPLVINKTPDLRYSSKIRFTSEGLIGMSPLLTTTMPSTKVTLNLLEEAGLRDQLKALIGGAPVAQEYADKIGADGYAPDAALAIKKANELVQALVASG